MSQYDLRSLFALNGEEFVVGTHRYICRLAEVSDLRPESDRLSWYLVFDDQKSRRNEFRKLEIVTAAARVLEQGWPPEARPALQSWLEGEEQDGRLEWLKD